MRQSDYLAAAISAAADTRRRVVDLAARNAPVPFPVLRAFVDRLQENFEEVVPLFQLASLGINVQALAEAELIAPPADVVSCFQAIRVAGQAVVTAYVTEVLPAYGPPVSFDAATGLHIDAVVPWTAMQPMMAPLADLDAALAVIV